MPAVERILQLWEDLNFYFLTEEKPPKILLNFFSDPMSEAYFWFIYNQMGVLNKQINKVQVSIVSVIEMKSLLDETLCTLNERKEEDFVGMKVKEILSEDEVSENMARKFSAETADFF
jgi:hypothetical protein